MTIEELHFYEFATIYGSCWAVIGFTIGVVTERIKRGKPPKG